MTLIVQNDPVTFVRYFYSSSWAMSIPANAVGAAGFRASGCRNASGSN
jgi:hypothetical protein